MSYTVERINEQPIILIRMLAPLNPYEDLSNLYRDSDALTADIAGKIYRVVDWTAAQLTFELVTDLLDTQRRMTAQTSPRSSRVMNHYVVSDHWGRFMIDAIRQSQYGGVQAPMFPNVEEALQHVRQAI